MEPFSALVAAAGGSRRDLVDGDFADHEERVLEGVVVVGDDGHGERGRD